MEQLVHPELIALMNKGILSFSRMQDLLELKSYIDRNATKKYADDTVVDSLYKKFKVKPSVITWGDYFQREIGYDYATKTDEEFIKVLDTIKFDILSSYIIFREKDEVFFRWVDFNYQSAELLRANLPIDEYEEAAHLKILKDYYLNLGITDNFTAGEWAWYQSFSEAEAVGNA